MLSMPFHCAGVCLFPPTESKLSRQAMLQNADIDDPASRKPPVGRRDMTTLSPLPPADRILVRRSDVCLSNFYKECAEPEMDCRCQPAERDGRYTQIR